MGRDKDVEDFKKSTKKRPQSETAVVEYLSTGSSLLNLACSGRVDGGFPVGSYIFLVGDSASGKSWLSLTCMAEACLRKDFDHYRLIHDDAENRRLMDVGRFFGSRLQSRLEPPAVDEQGNPIYSSTIEEFYYHLDDVLASDQPCIYVLDSMDSLSSEDEGDKFEENKKAYYAGKETKGSYGDGKAKKNSSSLRQIIPRLKKTNSILIIISQTRDNIGFGAQFNPKTRSGGRSLRFYASLEIWTSLKEHIKKDKRTTGIIVQAQVKKNCLTGREEKVEIPLYWSSGIDDLGGCVDFLVDEGHWKKTQGRIEAPELEFKGFQEDLIHHVEKEALEERLRGVAGQVWKDIEDSLKVERKRRYE